MGYYNLGRLDLIQIIKVDGEINRFKPKKLVDDCYREFLQIDAPKAHGHRTSIIQ